VKARAATGNTFDQHRWYDTMSRAVCLCDV
jgi:hypothetical protein